MLSLKFKLFLGLLFIIACFCLPFVASIDIDAQDDIFKGIFTKIDAEDKGDNTSKIKDIFDPLYDGSDGIEKFIDPEATPIIIESGVYVKSLGQFDYMKNSFFINFYIWWLLDKDVKYSPEETIEITNAQEYTRLWGARDTIGNKTRVQARFFGTINQNWDMKYFPFDRQKIRLSLEDNIGNINYVKFIPIPNNSKLSSDVVLRGWTLVRFDFIQEPHLYNTNFGNIDHPESIASRLNIIFELKRDGWSIFFVYFIGYIASLLLCLLTYFVPKRYFAETITLCLGAIFAGMGNKYQLDQSISDVNTVGVSLSGVATICTFMVILVTTVNVVMTHTIYSYGKLNLSYWISNSVLFILILVYGTVLGTALQLAVHS